MGTWGPGIFADDEAADVRSDFAHYLADAQDVAAATDAIAADYGACLAQPQHQTAFWLGLALTQWRKGWLDPRALAAALRVIDEGWDLAKWGDGRQAKARAKALGAARLQLVQPAPPPGPMPKPWPVQLADFRIGEILGRELPGGRLAVMKVTGFRRTTSLKVKGPAVRLQKWVKPTMPQAAEAAALECLRWPIAPNRIQTFDQLVLTAPRQAPLDRALFLRPGLVAPLHPDEARGSYTCVSTWPPYGLDDILASGVARWWDDPSLSADADAPWYAGPGRGPRDTVT